MNVAIFSNNYLPRVSGPAYAIEILRTNLEALGHNVYIFAPQYYNCDDRSAKIIRVPSLSVPHRIFYPIPLAKLSNIEVIFKTLNIDIIHSHHPIMLGAAALKFSKKYSIPLIYSYHSQWDRYLYKFFPVFPFNYISKIFKGINLNYMENAEAITVPNEVFKNQFSSKLRKKISVIPFPIAPLFFKKIPSAPFKIKKKLNLFGNSKIIFCATRLSFEKNVDFLIEAFSLVKKPNVFLVIAGDGVAKITIKNIIKTLNLTDKVILLGQIPHPELPLFYQGCDVFAQVSDFETQCLALNEAMASGCLIVAKSADYLKGVIKNEINGYISRGTINDFARKLTLALEKNEKHILFKKQAKQSAKKLAGFKIAQKFSTIYQQALKNYRCN